MNSHYSELQTRTMRCIRMFATPALFAILAMALPGASAHAASQPISAANAGQETYHTIYLTGLTRPSEGIDIVTDLRNVLRYARIYYVSSQHAISMMSTQQDYELAQKIVADLDHGPHVFRLTYTFTDFDHGQQTGHRSASVIVAAGDHVSVKQGNKIPVVTGTQDTRSGGTENQVQYLDLGLNIYADLSGTADDLSLRTKVEESALEPNKSNANISDPVIRQTVLDDGTLLTPGKPQMLGSLVVPGTGQKEQIEVTAEPVR